MNEYELVDANGANLESSISETESAESHGVEKRIDRKLCHGCCQKIFTMSRPFLEDCCGIDRQQQESREIIRWKYGLGIVEVILGANCCYWFQVVIHNKFCNFLFKCGCNWNWDGGWKDCNVHNIEGPRCPWCRARASISWTTDYLLTVLMIMSYIYLLSNRKKIIGQPICRILGPVLVYFTVGTVVGACFLSDGYPYFIF